MASDPLGSRPRPALARIAAALALLAACRKEAIPPSRGWTGPERVEFAVVVIHGVGNQDPGYSAPLEALVAERIPGVHVHEVLWSDLGTMLGLRVSVPPEIAAAREAWEKEIAEAEARGMGARGGGPEAARAREEYAAARGYLGPILRYEFVSAGERRMIQGRLREALAAARAHADRVALVAHSLGSVIAFDVLHGWEEGLPSTAVDALCTLGSPLDRAGFRGRGGRPVERPPVAACWINVYSGHDPIASRLAAAYAGVEDVEIATPTSPLAAHGAYWTHEEVVALLARWAAGG